MSEGTEDASAAQDAAQLLFSVLSPRMMEETKRLELGESDLVHYTTAENAVNIISGREFWLRSVRTMNDFMEVQHGINLLLKAFGGEGNPRIERLCSSLDKASQGAARAGIDLFNEWLPHLSRVTFIGCLSQADTNETDGRLSMWRAYSSPSVGVCIVMETTPFMAETDELKAYSLPVAYLSDDEFIQGIDNCLSSLEGIVDGLRGLNGDQISQTIFWWLLAMSVSLKHPGFHEEREWRVIYLPELARSESIDESIETVRGVPQIVQKIPLEDKPDAGLHGASPEKLIKKLIIGPTDHAFVVKDALVKALSQAGMDDAEERVIVSDIPLR